MTIIVLVLLLILIFALVALIIVRRRSAAKGEAGKPKDKATQKKKGAKKQSTAKEDEPAVANPKPIATAAAGNAILGGEAPKVGLPPVAPVKPAAGNEKIRILIVDDNTGTRENVSRLLYFEDDLEVIGQAVNGRYGVEMAIALKPHIVLMDINMPDMDGITATREMSNKSPFSQVIIMSVQADQHYMKQAMGAGARDFQPKPFTSEELVSCIRRVYNIGLPIYRQIEAMESSKAQQAVTPTKQVDSTQDKSPIIVVYSPKGGTGTSAIAANLAVALHQIQGDVVLMDGAFQFGDILVHLNTRPARTIVDLVHEGQLEQDLIQDVLLPHESGIKLLLAPTSPELADTITVPMIKEIIQTLQNQFNAVVLDTASKLTDETLAILELADYILVVATPDLPSIKSTKLFLELVAQLEYDLNHVGIVINRADIPGRIPSKQIKQVLKLDHLYHVPYDPKMYFSLNQGKSICLQEPTAPSSVAISDLTRDIWEQITEGKTLEKETV